jgi:hypothetical protein
MISLDPPDAQEVNLLSNESVTALRHEAGGAKPLMVEPLNGSQGW